MAAFMKRPLWSGSGHGGLTDMDGKWPQAARLLPGAYLGKQTLTLGKRLAASKPPMIISGSV
jgi:hypothetical protein